ncbi:MAG: CDP-diacylglycerol--glycerol-3-phosphate 3-phosphatidyltransferase [Acidobacteria bacterium]|jgi:CDP-diacylglycerol--glycerol-3-phosphate 3-phosphatidyltransferase|nr:MAG: CDP-diacylglycerol--glycerol-3-phosphate 3-phosphatidyltransferase [Acidobacteriota bacterium]GIU82262.1 MAG: CDP-diacylglycerol--glycerol-3-phosphate 3-phosphatidyltransferase [Pyrinomonadaceae bacterium]
MTLPNYLTLTRIFLVPLLVVILLTPVSEDWFGIERYALAIIIFLAASLTDILDGYLARKRNQVSKFGTLFDPIADKLLISAALIALVEKHLAPAWAVVIILGREFAVTGLRSVAASEGLIISAQKIGKIKMWAQCTAVVALLIAAANGTPPVSNFGWSMPTFRFWEVPEVRTAFTNLLNFSMNTDDWRVLGYTVGRGALWVAVITSIWSMYDYFKFFLAESKNIKKSI